MTFNKFKHLLSKNLNNSNILNYAAQLSYGLMLAFLPILMLFNFGIQFLSRYTEVQKEIFNFIADNFPSEISGLVLPTLISNNYNPLTSINSLLTNITLIVFLAYASARLIRSFMLISTNVMGDPPQKNFLVLWILAFRNLFIIIISLFIIIGIFLEAQYLVMGMIRLNSTGWRNILRILLNIGSYVYIILTSFLLLDFVMAKFPEKRLSLKEAAPGTLFILSGWGLLILLFKVLTAFLNYEGWSIIVSQGLIVLIVIYLISLVMVFGILINKTYLDYKRTTIKRSKKYA